MLRQIEPPDSIHYRAAIGWLELENHLEANEELENITPRFRTHPDVLELRWQIYAKERRWEACIDIADAIVKGDAYRPFGWIHRSFALHELKRTQEAFDNLLPAKDRFCDIWTIPYNLACYCSRLNQMEEAQEWFKKAMAIDEDIVKRMAVDDPDLDALLRGGMSGTLWKRA